MENRYQRGKVYKLIVDCDDCDLVYIGSTIQTLKRRFSMHKSEWKTGKKTCKSKLLFDYVKLYNRDIKIELIEKYPCNGRKELEKREGHYHRHVVCVNKCIAGRTKKEYYKDNKEKILKQRKQYREDNKERKKHYYENNKEKIAEQKKIKMTCECGSTFRKVDKGQHMKTKKHQSYIKTNNY